MTREVAWRAVTHGRVRSALPAWELARDDDHVVLHVPVGGAGFRRDGERGGPRNGFLLPDHALDTFSPTSWLHRDVVIVYRFGDGWSTWRWRDEGRWTDGAYVNLEWPWTASPAGWDTDDLTLDVVVHADGSVSFKDEDELAWAVGALYYTAAEAESITTVGRQAYAHAESRGWPLDADWDRWIPTTTALPALPDHWADRPDQSMTRA